MVTEMGYVVESVTFLAVCGVTARLVECAVIVVILVVLAVVLAAVVSVFLAVAVVVVYIVVSVGRPFVCVGIERG